jgi:hypothetical protein
MQGISSDERRRQRDGWSCARGMEALGSTNPAYPKNGTPKWTQLPRNKGQPGSGASRAISCDSPARAGNQGDTGDAGGGTRTPDTRIMIRAASAHGVKKCCECWEMPVQHLSSGEPMGGLPPAWLRASPRSLDWSQVFRSARRRCGTPECGSRHATGSWSERRHSCSASRAMRLEEARRWGSRAPSTPPEGLGRAS